MAKTKRHKEAVERYKFDTVKWDTFKTTPHILSEVYKKHLNALKMVQILRSLFIHDVT